MLPLATCVFYPTNFLFIVPFFHTKLSTEPIKNFSTFITSVKSKKSLFHSSIYSFFMLLSLLFVSVSSSRIQSNPTPTPWPHQFHSIVVINFSGSNEIINLWYDWTNGRNFNIIQKQLGDITYHLEWNNGTSFVWTSKKCSSVQLEVGILVPNWLDGAKYLGQQKIDGFLCNVWEKVDFIWYYEDVVTKGPVHWVFYTGRSAHVMTFEVGAVLEDEHWQAPVYCFEGGEKEDDNSDVFIEAPWRVF